MLRDKKSPANKSSGDILSKKSASKRPPVSLPVRFKPKFWEESDRRCVTVRAIKARYERLMADAGGGDSYQRDLLIQRAVFISVHLETQEVRAAEGGEIDLGSYIQGANALSGLLKTLGLERHAKDVTDLKAYLRGKNGGVEK